MDHTYTLVNCTLTRLDVDDEHYYYGSYNNKPSQYFLSVTKVLDIGAPFPEGLRDYLRVSTYEEQKERLEFTGDRGKRLHEALEKLMHSQEVNLAVDHKTVYEKEAVVVFIRVMRFLQPKRFQTELVVAEPTQKLAGTLDLHGWADNWRLEALLNPTKYLEIDSDGDYQLKDQWLALAEQSKRIHFVWDHKFTGRNTYSHKVQVAKYKSMYNHSYKGAPVSRAFTWRYSPRHKFGFDFQESTLSVKSFDRIYDTTIDYLGEFPAPPMIKRYPDTVCLFKAKEKKDVGRQQ